MWGCLPQKLERRKKERKKEREKKKKEHRDHAELVTL
jgi:hypothetical protein